jgi:hypothetical protein
MIMARWPDAFSKDFVGAPAKICPLHGAMEVISLLIVIAICRFNPMSDGDSPAVTVAYDSDGDLAGVISSRAILGGLPQHYGWIWVFGTHRSSAMRRLLYPPITFQSFGLFQSAHSRVS